jgi:hypothetical protein
MKLSSVKLWPWLLVPTIKIQVSGLYLQLNCTALLTNNINYSMLFKGIHFSLSWVRLGFSAYKMLARNPQSN